MSLPASKLQAMTALVVIVIGGLFLTVVLTPIYLSARAASSKTNCLSNVKTLAVCALMYTSDHDRFMDAHHWSDAPAFQGEESTQFTCLKSSGINYSYAMNAALSGRRSSMLATPEAAPLFLRLKGDDAQRIWR